MDKKLTDSEIVKALESYIKDIGCAKCDFKDKYLLTVLKSTLALISRLQAENERLKEENEHYSHNVKEMTDSIRNYQKALEQARAENEKLKEENQEQDQAVLNALRRTRKIRLDAYKEFAERLKEKRHICLPPIGYPIDENDWIIVEDDIDDTLKEMVGDK